MKITVIVPVRDGQDTLPRLLDALRHQTRAPDEVVIVDNGSRDAGPQLIRDHPLQARLLTEPRTGSYAARNAGIAAATGDVLAFTDADCTPDPSWLEAGLRALQAGADLVAGHVAPEVGELPSVWEKFDAGHHVDQRKYVEVLGFGATANLLVRQEVFAAVGAFDPGLKSGGDREFCVRATGRGFRLAYAAQAAVRHRSRSTPRETWRLHRRLGAGLRDLSRRGLQPRFWRDDQMLLPIGWAAEVTNAVAPRPDGRPHRQRELLPLATVVVAARWTGRMTGR